MAADRRSAGADVVVGMIILAACVAGIIIAATNAKDNDSDR